MSIEENKAIVGRWFTEFWGKDFDPAVPWQSWRRPARPVDDLSRR